MTGLSAWKLANWASDSINDGKNQCHKVFVWFIIMNNTETGSDSIFLVTTFNDSWLVVKSILMSNDVFFITFAFKFRECSEGNCVFCYFDALDPSFLLNVLYVSQTEFRGMIKWRHWISIKWFSPFY